MISAFITALQHEFQPQLLFYIPMNVLHILFSSQKDEINFSNYFYKNGKPNRISIYYGISGFHPN